MMPIRDQFAVHAWLAQSELEKAGHAMNAAAPRRGHAIKCVRCAAHPVLEPGPRLLVPRVGMSSAHAHVVCRKTLDRFECSI